jgi:hypothetical protein
MENYDESIARCSTCNVKLKSSPTCVIDGKIHKKCSPNCPEGTSQRGCPLQPHPNNEQQRKHLNTCQGINGQKVVTEKSHEQLKAFTKFAANDIFKVPRCAAGSKSQKILDCNASQESCNACRATAWRGMHRGVGCCDAKLTSPRQCQIDSLCRLDEVLGVCPPHSPQGQDRSHGYQPQILFSGLDKDGRYYLNTPLQHRPLVELIVVAWLQGMQQTAWPTEITADHMCQIAEWWEFSSGTRSKKEPPLRVSKSSALGNTKRTRLVQRLGRYLYRAFSKVDVFPDEFQG